jgi:hypothetical protein
MWETKERKKKRSRLQIKEEEEEEEEKDLQSPLLHNIEAKCRKFGLLHCL